ncbi:radial spoke head 14 homolog isoform X3 [Equus caballus]|uniref:radial spoke head 14 homolog isoform X3 n=1 Tax=Equus caballus TaxID=9796 RepID=UPI0038B2637D
MASAQISMYLPPDVNPSQAAIAYGCRALPKLNKELQSEDLLTRQKALMALCDLVHDPEHVYVAIDIGCLESLKALLKDTNDMVRLKTTEVLYIMATHNVGREGFLKYDVIHALSYLLHDPQAACRENLHLAYKHLAQVPSGAQGIVNSGLIPALVWKLQREEENIQELLLDTLAACLMEDATEALDSRLVPFLKEKLLSTNNNIRSKAARTLVAISIPLEGKKQIWQYDVIPILVHLLKDKVKEVQANAAGALMYATVTTEELGFSLSLLPEDAICMHLPSRLHCHRPVDGRGSCAVPPPLRVRWAPSLVSCLPTVPTEARVTTSKHILENAMPLLN